jgi:lysozyme
MSLLGIDVSHYQGTVDWFAVARGNVSFAFAKATDGNTLVDPTFSQNWPKIQDAGLFRGAYHFARPSHDPEAQAALFASVVGPLGFRDLPPVLDLEESEGRNPADVLAWARAFVTRAEQLFRRTVMIYTGGFWRFALKNPNDAFFAARPLWLASYGPNPVVPASWTKFAFWQYTEGKNNQPVPVPGVAPCDQDRFNGSEAELGALCTGGVIAAPATPAPAVGAPPPQAAVDPGDWPGVFFVWPNTPAIEGDSVKRWQERVLELGYTIEADGSYGPQSKSACIAFQKDRGLSADGIVGRSTWNATFA